LSGTNEALLKRRCVQQILHFETNLYRLSFISKLFSHFNYFSFRFKRINAKQGRVFMNKEFETFHCEGDFLRKTAPAIEKTDGKKPA
jgi:hypothetical protein